MIYLKNILSISLGLVLFLAASSGNVLGFSFGPPDKLTGAPNEGNCTQCHIGNTLNRSGGSLMLTVPENYSPGEVYDIVVKLSRAEQKRWGFEMTALNSSGARAGTFATADGNTQVTEKDGKQYIKQTFSGIADGKKDSNSWTFKWTAPTTDTGTITFYAAGNAANRDFTSQGDYIYTQKATSDIAPVYGLTLTGVGALTTQTRDVSSGVSYTLRITNTGNTSDTFRLTTSGDANATFSRPNVSLAPNASTTVTVTVAGTALSAAGTYAVKVTATSQGDSAETAEVSTMTTVLPVYDVALAGVGALTKEISDASSGVSYTVRITNTGNTSDTFRLSTSGDVLATLSRTAVFLGRGASTTVTLRVSGAVLFAAGSYAVKVTATSQGDSAQTAVATTTTTVLPVYGVTLAGVGALTKEISDASSGVSYTVRITNTGNTSDTFRLSTSGDVSATVSQSTVSLARGAATEVTLTVSDPALSAAGTYAVKVTATSQGDSTQTADVLTTTTVLPVYGVTLAGVGALTKEISDASSGVSYTVRITNTGNTSDTFRLSTSGDVLATLSRTAVFLGRGASTTVTLGVSGAALSAAGGYAVKVTATSQGDSTQTAVATTTTTVLPVYGVTLAGVGALSKEISDASSGVSYVLRITNTGNTSDTFRLSTSGDVSATVSQSTVSLARGAATEVTLTVSDPALSAAGSYAVKVTATSQGDSTQTAVATTTTVLPVYGVMFAGDSEHAGSTMDALSGVSYTLTVTNTGNTDDTIVLGSSAEVGIEGSVLGTFTKAGSEEQPSGQLAVSLSAGASTEVIFTTLGDFFTKPGDYVIEVTATSQTDSTQTADVLTTTTVLPVYGVTLTGVGTLAKEISDVSAGVNYTLQVTNTGNTDDVIDIAVSGDVSATVSQSTVSLARGAATEVTLTVSDSTLSAAGSYAVQVTATSQSDSTQTADVSTMTTVLPVYGVTIVGVDSLTKAIAAAGEPVIYTFKITNTGNTDDVIDVSITGDAAATLSQSTVSLSAGASSEVTMTVATTTLSTAGDYAVTFTTTSQGDSTQTATTTTTTTLLPVTPVYGVMFAGDSERAGSTMDVLSGVSYTLTVTNTGNMDDTIVLGSSAEVGIEGSVLGTFAKAGSEEQPGGQLAVSLSAGASTEVIFAAAGDFFTKPGDYAIEVTATSQTDSTQTAELTITTTITPVPSDVNADGVVNILDLVKVANQFGKVGDGLVGDVTMDGSVNILDLVRVSTYFGKTQAEIVQLTLESP